MSDPIKMNAICCEAGKSGGGPPQSKTLRAARKSWDGAKRLGVRQSSGALLREPKCKINPNGIIQSIFCRASGTVAALVVFLAVGARAETTNTLSNAEIQGRELAQQLCDAQPAENFTNTGILQIRDGNGNRTNYSFSCKVFVQATNWVTIYASDSIKPWIEELSIIHAANLPNVYIHARSGVISRMGLPNEQASPFAFSDFWLCDLGLQFFHWPAQKILPKTTNLKRGREYTLLESTNPSPSTNGYSRVLSWIDKESGGILQAEAYDAQGKLLKVFEPKSFKKVNGQWELQEMEIRNVQTGSRTRLEFNLKKD